jgi:glycine/D-amino acid oxidase-like deaminating enzyme
MTDTKTILVVGGGIFGITAAVELGRRGWGVRLLDVERPPARAASSTDVSKAVRMDYGADGFYVDLAARAIEGWNAWNRSFRETVFLETGFLLMTPRTMESGGFEHDSFVSMRQRGVAVERLDGVTLRRRFPVWGDGPWVDGYFNPAAGWAASARVVEILAGIARSGGVRIERGTVREVTTHGGCVTGVRTEAGESVAAGRVLVAAGARSAELVPALRPFLRVTGQPVVHFAPHDPARFAASRFPVWAADIARTGWYGFPASSDGRVKVANHGPGRPVEPDREHRVTPAEIDRFRRFLSTGCPELAEAPLAATRLCLYCDSIDGDFWIDRVPGLEGLTVATGGSGHAFKFAPVLGPLVADAVEGRADPSTSRFRFRAPDPRGRPEQARGTR